MLLHGALFRQLLTDAGADDGAAADDRYRAPSPADVLDAARMLEAYLDTG